MSKPSIQVISSIEFKRIYLEDVVSDLRKYLSTEELIDRYHNINQEEAPITHEALEIVLLEKGILKRSK